MFVSILQRFGFKASRQSGQPLQSRADQNTKADAKSGVGAGVHPEAASQRRQAVKAKPAKSAEANKPASKVKIAAKVVAKGGKAVVKPKATLKAAPKTAPKVAAKPAPKKIAKHVVKSKTVVKKPVVKAASKPVPKKPAKAKAAPKATIKPISKTNAKVAPSRAAKFAPKAPAASAKVKVKVVAKPVAKARPAKASTLPAATKKPAKPAKSAKAVKVAAPAVAPVPVTVAPKLVSHNGLPPPPPLKPGRRSSARALAHMPPPAPMVPTHAPDAAKASYSIMTERVIAPPPHVAAKKDPKLANNWKTKAPAALTDDEVKAMPDAEYMNDTQMAFFRHKLSILKQEIHNSAGATTEHLREDTVVVPDPADRATIEEEHALELRTRDRERKLLKKIEQSIARIDSGDYGYCDETGEPIGVGRLIARPTANLSLEAQQRRELKQKMFGD